MNTKIIVDSACDLPVHIMEEYQIEELPFNIHIDDESYLDGKTIETSNVYSALKNDQYPKTSQVSPRFFRDAFTKYAKKDIDIIYISFSAELSSAYQTGKLVAQEIEKKYPEVTIDVIDSKSGSVATGIIVYKAAQMLAEGADHNEVIDKINFWIDHIEHFFILDDLNTLQRGGRISKTKSFIGNMLNIKPVLQVKEGKIELHKKVRGTKRALNTLVRLLQDKSYDLKEQLIGIAHADDFKKAENLKEKVQSLGGEIFCVELISSVLGAHLGIGGIGIFFLSEVCD